MIEIGELLSVALFFGGLGVAYIGYRYLQENGFYNRDNHKNRFGSSI